jgi:hypothetical protein
MSSTTADRSDRHDDDAPDRARTFARLFGIAFLLVGIAGFIPGITTNYDDMGFMSDSSDAEIFGLFQTSVLHNLVHLAFGVAGLAMSRRWSSARKYLLWSGVIYLVLFVYGLFVGGREDEKWINFIPVNNEDDVLHLLLGLGLLAAYLASRGRHADDEARRLPARESVAVAPATVTRVEHDPRVADGPLTREPLDDPAVVEPVDADRPGTRT